MKLPVGLDTSHAFGPAGTLDRIITTPAAAGGTTTATFETVHDNELWLIERVVVTCTSSSTTTAVLYSDEPTPRRILDGSSSGNFDVADNTSPMRVGPGETLLCVWTGTSAGAVGTCRVQGLLMRRAG